MDKNINVLLYGYGEGMRGEGGINEMLYWFLILIKLRGKEKKSGVSLKLLILSVYYFFCFLICWICMRKFWMWYLNCWFFDRILRFKFWCYGLGNSCSYFYNLELVREIYGYLR